MGSVNRRCARALGARTRARVFARSIDAIPVALVARVSGTWSQGRVEVLRRSCAACLERAGLVVRIAQRRVEYPPHPRRASVPNLPPASLPAAPLRKTPDA